MRRLNKEVRRMPPCKECGESSVGKWGKVSGSDFYVYQVACGGCENATDWSGSLREVLRWWLDYCSGFGDHVEMVRVEYGAAVEKYPLFVQEFCSSGDARAVGEMLGLFRDIVGARTDRNETTATSILQCELWEAVEAYVNGDFDNCLKELAQCAAVIFRAMHMVAEEGKRERGGR